MRTSNLYANRTNLLLRFMIIWNQGQNPLFIKIKLYMNLSRRKILGMHSSLDSLVTLKNFEQVHAILKLRASVNIIY